MNPEDAAELKTLFDALPEATERANKALMELGMTNERYKAEDARVTEILTRISQLLHKNS